jgi:thioredoxin 1
MDEELARIREKKLREMEEKMKGGPEEKKPFAGVLPVDESSFSALLSQNPLVVVDFWAEWCGPCRMVGPVVEELAREFAGRITFAKCNTDHCQRLASQFGISAIPSIFLFSQGKIVDKVIGACPIDVLRDRIKRAFRMG